MNERIKQLRKTLGLTLEKFGEHLGVKKNTISALETGRNSVTEYMVKAICREFNVNEEWLRDGTGEMFRLSDLSDNKATAVKEWIFGAVTIMDENAATNVWHYILDCFSPDVPSR